MSEVKPLSAEDVALLASLPSIGEPGATLGSAWRDRIRRLRANQYVVVEDSLVWRSFHADTLLATITNERQQAAEGERRRIDDLIEGFHDGEFTVAIAENGGWCVIDPPLGDCSKLPSLGNGDSPLAAILAAANSLNKEQTNGD